MEVLYENLHKSDLNVDTIYKGGTQNNISAEPLHLLFPKCGTSGGFRKVAIQVKTGIHHRQGRRRTIC